MSESQDKLNQSNPSPSNNLGAKLILGAILGALLAKVLSFQIMADALGMSTGGFIFMCVIVALLVAIFIRLKSSCGVVAANDAASATRKRFFPRFSGWLPVAGLGEGC
jgi:hypothetical protein